MLSIKSFIIIILLCFVTINAISQELLKIERNANVSVTVSSFDGNVFSGELIAFRNIQTREEFSGITDSSGRFIISLPKYSRYAISVKNLKDHFSAYTPLKAELYLKKTTNNAEVQVLIEEPSVLTLDNILFDSGKITLKREAENDLKLLINTLKKEKPLQIEIGGHTDNIGDPAENKKLSEERANTVKDYLISEGIPSKYIFVIGYGDKKPIDNNTTNSGRSANRRTEIKIIKRSVSTKCSIRYE